MIAYVKGELAVVLEDNIVVETNGIGYNIKVPTGVLSYLPTIGSQVKIHTYTYVREDTFSLYGFLTLDDLSMFKLLITVNGIGPKAALAILSCMNGDELRIAIISQDAKAIAKAPGVGAKTASRVILDLKDKVSIEDTLIHKESEIYQEKNANNNVAGITNEAIEALVALGYSSSDALKAVKKVNISEGMNVEGLLKLALKNMF
ncbi:MAG: Holliday junction branch migration protein RuvA [Eubacteriales bacterium]